MGLRPSARFARGWSSAITLIKLLVANWQPWPVKVKFHFIFIFMLVWHIVWAYMQGKNDWSFIWARCDYCHRMSDFDSCQFILIRMAYKVLISPRSNVTFDISLHEVCVRVGVRYVMTKFSRMNSLPNFLTHGAPQAGASRTRELLY